MQKIALLALVLPLAACSAADADPASVTATVAADTQLSTLEAALIQADLDGTLADEGATYTVFAPTDAAFATLQADLGVSTTELLARPDLASILGLHVVSGAALGSGTLNAGETLMTLNGETLTVVAVGGGLGLDTDDLGPEADAVLLDTDIEATNGVIHRIDAVLRPAGG